MFSELLRLFSIFVYAYRFLRDALHEAVNAPLAIYRAFGRFCAHLVLPLVLEYRRFYSVFYPTPVPWYDTRCIWHEELDFVDRLLAYLRGSPPHYVCVWFVSWWDCVYLGIVVCGCVVLLSGLLRWAFYSPLGRTWFSRYVRLLRAFTTQPPIATSATRTTFQTTPLVAAKQPAAHTHPVAASTRNSGSAFIDLVTKLLGMRAYYLQRSRADESNERAGCRSYYWGKDINLDPVAYDPAEFDVSVIVDADMYMDMPHLLSFHPGVYMVSTFQPTSPTSTSGDYSFTFDVDNNVRYKVAGGAEYVHPVWSYSSDVLVARADTWHLFWHWFPIASRITVYNVDRRQLDEHHQVILLTPTATLLSPIVDVSRWLGGERLRRLTVAVGRFLRMDIQRTDGLYRATGIAGAYAHAIIPAALDDTIASVSRQTKHELSTAQVRQQLGDDSEEQTAVVLSEFHRTAVPDKHGLAVPTEESVIRYQFDPKSYDPTAKPVLVPFMDPIVLGGCYAPDRTKANDQRCIDGRIVEVKPKDVELTPFLIKTMNEFAAFLVPDRNLHRGDPLDIDDVYERQSRPTQVRILDEAVSSSRLTSVFRKVKSFMKGESYAEPKDPRNITTIPGVNKLHYSRYLYAFSHYLKHSKHIKWFAFGKTPRKIAKRIARMAQSARSNMGCSDLSRCDGRISHVLRMLERLSVLRFFRLRHHPDLNELAESQRNARGSTRHGVSYETGDSRLSGSPETSDFNTVDDAYVAYLHFRMTRVNGEFMTPQESWEALGLYGGDDGITPDVNEEILARAATAVGQVVKCDVVARGEAGVMFLSRIFSPLVWYGSADSMCDVKRQLVKFHAAPPLPPTVSPAQKLAERCTGFFMTDPNTPVLGPLSTAVVNLLGKVNPRHKLASYFSRYPEHQQFPNLNEGDWMREAIRKQLPDFQFDKFDAWLAESQMDIEKLLHPPVCCTIPLVSKVAHPIVTPADPTGRLTQTQSRPTPPPTPVSQILPTDLNASALQVPLLPTPPGGQLPPGVTVTNIMPEVGPGLPITGGQASRKAKPKSKKKPAQPVEIEDKGKGPVDDSSWTPVINKKKKHGPKQEVVKFGGLEFVMTDRGQGTSSSSGQLPFSA